MSMVAQFPLSLKKTVEAIEEYKSKVKNGTFPKADFWHFCGEYGLIPEQVTSTIKAPTNTNKEVSKELKKFCAWLRGQYNTAPGWSGPNSSKSIFANKQDFDGQAMIDKQEQKTTGEMQVSIRFGGSKDAFK